MTRFSHLLLATLLAGVPTVAVTQAVTPTDHPGFVLAEAIAAQGCVLHQDDVNALLEAAGLVTPQFPQMTIPLMQDGYLMPSGEGTLTLVNWGLCLPLEAEESAEDAPADDLPAEATPAQTE